MNTQDFAKQFQLLYRQTYALAVRRIEDKRHRLSPETVGILLHLSIMGPSSLGELARHLSRAPSTTSEMVAHLTEKGLIEKDRDPADGRRNLIWLSSTGQMALQKAQDVLNSHHLEKAGAVLSQREREDFTSLFQKIINALKENNHE